MKPTKEDNLAKSMNLKNEKEMMINLTNIKRSKGLEFYENQIKLNLWRENSKFTRSYTPEARLIIYKKGKSDRIKATKMLVE